MRVTMQDHLLRSHCRHSQSGFTLITVTLSLSLLIAFAGLAADVGYLEFVKRHMQTAADAGAIAGDQEVLRNDTSQIQPAALHDATKNGYTDGSNNTTVTVNHPPTSGYYSGDSSAVEVIIQQSNQPLTFLSVLGLSPATVAARAVAHLGAGDGCLIALDSSGRGAITFNGNGGSINLGSCNVLDNSANCSGMIDNSATVIASAFDVVGNCPGYTGSGYSTTPSSGVLPAPDPYASLPAPPVGPCPGSLTFNQSTATSTTLQPGTYCGGISINGGNWTFAPGTYVMYGGDLTIKGGANVTGSGVFFYLTGNLTGAPAYRYGGVNIDGTTTVNFVAPSSGTYKDILFYQDRSLNLTSRPSMWSNIGGSSTSNYTGVFYFPTSQVTFAGSPGMSAMNVQIVAWQVTVSGNVALNANFSAMPGGGRPDTVVLGE